MTLDEALAQIDELAQLEDDWDGYDGLAPGATAIEFATMAVRELDRLGVTIHGVAPMPEADVNIELSDGGDVFLDCYDQGVMVFGAAESGTAELIELPGTPEGVQEAMKALAAHREKCGIG